MKDNQKIEAVRALGEETFYLGSAKFCFEAGLGAEEVDVFMEALARAKANPPGEKWRRLTITIFSKILREGELEQAIGAAFSCGQAYEVIKLERGWQ